MITVLEGMKADVLGVEATGVVSADDYRNVLIPAVDEKLETHQRIGLLYFLGPQFERYELGAAWEDTKVGFKHLSDFRKIAVVTPHDWVAKGLQAFGAIIPCPVKCFGWDQQDQAKAWIQEPETTALTIAADVQDDLAHLHVTLSGALGQEMERGLIEGVTDAIQGATRVRLLIEAQDFHGWSDITALWLHVKFVVGVKRKIERLAIVGEAAWQRRLVSTGRHLLGVEARYFPSDQLDSAKTWVASND